MPTKKQKARNAEEEDKEDEKTKIIKAAHL